MRTETMIAVSDVEVSSRWYQELLRVRGDHGGKEFDRLVGSEGVVLLLHHWGAPEHPSLGDANAGPIGHGLVLHFRVASIAPYFERAKKLAAPVLHLPWHNPQSRQEEFTIRDPDGYVVTVCAQAAV